MVKPKTHMFPNGFRVIYEKPTNVLKLTTIDVFCDVGSVFEKDGIRGVSHFVEHMCFKGTTKIPNPKDIFLSYDKIHLRLISLMTKNLQLFNNAAKNLRQIIC